MTLSETKTADTNTAEARRLAAFSSWLEALSGDVRLVGRAVGDASLPAEQRALLVGALNYLFKSLDLIDDGIESLGFLDDAFVLRLAAAQAARVAELPEALVPLSRDAELALEFLGELASRFEAYVATLPELVVRGRTTGAVLTEEETREEFLGEVLSWASRFEPPSFTAEGKNLVKFRAFLEAKLAS